MTRAQKEILKIVREQKHLTADEVYAEAKKEIANIALGTVYRNLNAFAEKDTIRRIQRGDAPDFYDGKPSPHGHVICSGCGGVSDIDIPELEGFVQAHIDMEILTVELLARCVCKECGQKAGGHND